MYTRPQRRVPEEIPTAVRALSLYTAGIQNQLEVNSK